MILRAIAAVVLGTTCLAGAAQAQMVAALVGGDTLALIDVQAKKAVKTVKVQGVSGKLLGIDVRPADGMLYGLTSQGAIVTIDGMSGQATEKSKLDMPLATSTVMTIDFNPVADRMRIIGQDGTNLRVNVDDGKVAKDANLKFADADIHNGKTPKVIAGAYTNSMKGTKETALFDIDALGVVVKQAPPNDGILNSVGPLGVKPQTVAFDIVSDGNGGNEAWLLSNGTLYKVDLSTGKATSSVKIGGVKGNVQDIAILPMM